MVHKNDLNSYNSFVPKTCENCLCEFVTGKTKREKLRRFCSSFCARSFNGKSNKGRKRTKKHREKMSKIMQGKKNPFYGKKHSKETIEKMSNSKRNKSWEKRFGKEKANALRCLYSKMFSGEENPFYGKKHSKQSRKLISENHRNCSGKNNPMYGKGYLIQGKKNPAWNGGVSYGEYGPNFNETLKKEIRNRDNYVCFICKKNGWVVHHIDYDKNNNLKSNLITLCNSCHAKTNFNREIWLKYFKGDQNEDL